MAFGECKVYSDGSHYIAIPPSTNPKKRRPKPPEEQIVVMDDADNFTETEHVECYPIPAYVEQKGRAQGYYPDCSVVYIRILWKEFEPVEGQFNYALIQEVLDRAEEVGQTVMFRLLTHSTRESDDVPDWLKEKIECPARPEGMRVKDCPKDPKFLDYFGAAVRALGERFDSDPTLAFMDISLRYIPSRFFIIVHAYLCLCWHFVTQPVLWWYFSETFPRLSALYCKLVCGRLLFYGIWEICSLSTAMQCFYLS
jgi:hypothetical protein